jgi:hypothetical protein
MTLTLTKKYDRVTSHPNKTKYQSPTDFFPVCVWLGHTSSSEELARKAFQTYRYKYFGQLGFSQTAPQMENPRSILLPLIKNEEGRRARRHGENAIIGTMKGGM